MGKNNPKREIYEEYKKDHYFRLIIFSCLLLSIMIVPVFYYMKAHDISELPKITLLRILTGISIALWGIWLLFRKKEIVIPPKAITIFVLLFLFSWIISTILSTNRYLSFFGSYMRQLGFFSYSVFFIIFFLLSDVINTEKELKYFYWGIAIIAFVVGIVGLQQFFRLSSWFERVRVESRIISTLGHADFLGHYLVMVIPIILSLIFATENIYIKSLLFIEFIILFMTLLASYTRGSWIAFIVTFPLFMGGLGIKTDIFKNFKNKIFASLAIVGIFLTVFSFNYLEKKLYPPNTPLGTFSLQERFSTISQGLGISQANPRMLTWRDSMNLFKDKLLSSPRIIWGLGPETFSFNFTPYKSLDLARYDRGKGYPDREHNEFLDVLFPQGLLGLISFLGIIFSTIFSFFKYLNRIFKENRVLAFGIFIGFLAFLVQSLVLFGLTATYLYFWSLIAFIFIELRFLNGKEKIVIEVKNISQFLKYIITTALLLAAFFYVFISLNFFKAEIFYRYGLDYLGSNEPGKALALIEEAIKLRPQESAFHEAAIKACLQIIGGVEDEKDKEFYFNKGKDHIKDLLKNAYYRSLTYNLVGAFYAQSYNYLGKKDKELLKKAEENLYIALTYDKYAVPPLENLLKLYLTDLPNKNKAEEIVKRIIEIDPLHLDANLVLASLYYEKERLEEAKEIYEKLSKNYPNNIDVWNNLGIVYFKLREYKKSKDAFLQVLKIDPANVIARKNIEIVSLVLGEPVEIPFPSKEKEVEYYLKEGVSFYNKGDYKKAEEYFRKVIAIDENSSEGYNNLGAVLFLQKQYESAVTMFKKAIEINPRYLQAYGNLVVALKELGRKEEARNTLLTALKYFPDNPDLKKLLEEMK